MDALGKRILIWMLSVKDPNMDALGNGILIWMLSVMGS